MNTVNYGQLQSSPVTTADNSYQLLSPLYTMNTLNCRQPIFSNYCAPWMNQTINNPSLVTTVHHKCIELLTTPICSNHQCKPWIHWTANNPSHLQTYHCMYTTSLLSYESDPVSPMPCCNRVPRTQDLESPLQRIQNCQRIPTLSVCPVVYVFVHGAWPWASEVPTLSVCPVVYVLVQDAWSWCDVKKTLWIAVFKIWLAAQLVNLNW